MNARYHAALNTTSNFIGPSGITQLYFFWATVHRFVVCSLVFSANQRIPCKSHERGGAETIFGKHKTFLLWYET